MTLQIQVEMHDVYLHIYIYIPGTCLSSILGVEPSKRRPFSSKTKVIWVLGIYYICKEACICLHENNVDMIMTLYDIGIVHI